MRFFKYNIGAATAALVLIVLLAVPFGVYRSVSSLTSRVEDSFTQTQVKSDLAKYASHAENFAAAYGAFCGEDAALREAIRAYKIAADSPFSLQDEMDTLSSLAANAYYKASLLTAEGMESLKTSLTAYYYEMQSDEMRLQNNTDYAKKAEAYNRAVRAFPASLLAQNKSAVTFD